MAEVLGSAEIDVFYRSREDQLRRSVDESAQRVEKGQQARPLTVPTRVDERGMAASFARVNRAATAFQAVLAFQGLRTGVKALSTLTDAASRLEEQQNAVNVTFDDSAHIIEDFASSAAFTAGVSESAAMRASAAFGALFTNIGATNDQAAKLSAGAVQLAGDLASIRDLKVDDALAKIQAGLVGETEPLRRVGILLNDMVVRTKAVEMGLADQESAVTDNAKVLARYQLIIEGIGDGAGDFARTIDSAANAQRAAAAASENLSATLGEALTPALAQARGGFASVTLATDSMLESLGTGGLASVLSGLTIGWRTMGLMADRVASVFGESKLGTNALENAQDALKSATDSLNASLSTETDLMRSIRDGTADLVGMQIDRIEAQFSTERSSMRMVEADMRVTDAQARLNEVLQRTGEYTERVTAAQERARSAEDALTDARRRAVQAEEQRADAADAVAAAEFRFGVQSREAEEARRNLRDSTWEAEEAQEAIADVQRDAAAAQRELTEAQSAGGPKSREAAEAQLALSRAIADQREAVVTDAEAHLRLIDTTKALNGETLTAGERAKIFTERLNAVASTLAPDAPLRRHITDTTAAMAELAAVGGGFSLGPGNAAPTRAQLTAPPGGMRLGPGHDTPRGGTVIIQNMHINNAVDARQVAYDIAWQAGGSR